MVWCCLHRIALILQKSFGKKDETLKKFYHFFKITKVQNIFNKINNENGGKVKGLSYSINYRWGWVCSMCKDLISSFDIINKTHKGNVNIYNIFIKYIIFLYSN